MVASSPIIAFVPNNMKLFAAVLRKKEERTVEIHRDQKERVIICYLLGLRSWRYRV